MNRRNLLRMALLGMVSPIAALLPDRRGVAAIPLPDGRTIPVDMTEVDHDNPPLTKAELSRLRRVPLVKRLRWTRYAVDLAIRHVDQAVAALENKKTPDAGAPRAG